MPETDSNSSSSTDRILDRSVKLAKLISAILIFSLVLSLIYRPSFWTKRIIKIDEAFSDTEYRFEFDAFGISFTRVPEVEEVSKAAQDANNALLTILACSNFTGLDSLKAAQIELNFGENGACQNSNNFEGVRRHATDLLSNLGMLSEQDENKSLFQDTARNWMVVLASTTSEREALKLLAEVSEGKGAIITVTDKGLYVPAKLYRTQQQALDAAPQISKAISRNDLYVSQILNWCDEVKDENANASPIRITCTRDR
ncbi:hypothetical protein [Thalassovita sp.]|uniref:hypothetical protein n=1 Tax=Thalassovita sp. TaxID=1979401 RepID=UPI002AB27B51|nr:hypothetical protein [Thalassovita sp.]